MKKRTGPEFALSLCSFLASGFTSVGTSDWSDSSSVLTTHTVTARVTLAGAVFIG